MEEAEGEVESILVISIIKMTLMLRLLKKKHTIQTPRRPSRGVDKRRHGGIKSPHSNILGCMIAKENEGFVNINNVSMKVLIDSGSQINTIIVECQTQLNPQPKLRSLDDLEPDSRLM